MYKYNMGGTVPRETTIGGQRHNLAYINPFEEDLLNTQYRGGEGQSVPPNVGPGGVPAYNPNDQGQKNVRQTQSFDFGSSGSNRDEHDRRADRAIAESQARTNQAYAALTAVSSNDRPQARPTATPTVRPQARPVNFNNPAEVSSKGGSATAGPSAEEIKAAKILREAKKITGLESLANFFTQGSGPDNEGSDFMKYNEAGELVYEIGHPTGKAGELVDPTLKNSFGFKVGMANSNRNDETPGRFNQGIGSGFKTDLDMAFAAGFGTPEEQRAKLILAGYSEADAAAYVAKTEATREAGFPGPVDDGNDNPAATVSGIDPFAFTGVGGGTPGKAAADPCPEGFIMDPATNACVPMDDTNSGYLGLPSYVTPDPSVPLTDFSQPAVLGQPNLQPYAPINSGTGGNFIQGTNQNNFNQGGIVGYANGGEVGEDKSYSERIIDKAVELFGDASELSISKVIELGSKAAPYAKLVALPGLGAADIMMQGSGILAEEFLGANPFASRMQEGLLPSVRSPQSNEVQKFNRGGPVGGIMDLLR